MSNQREIGMLFKSFKTSGKEGYGKATLRNGKRAIRLPILTIFLRYLDKIYGFFCTAFTALFLLALGYTLTFDNIPPSHKLSKKTIRIANSLGLTEKSLTILKRNKIFYLNSLESVRDFCSKSKHHSEGTLFGCYTNRTIYLYENSDQRFNGLTEHILAHEFLHSVFFEISSTERRTISKSLSELKKHSSYHERVKVYNESHDLDSEEFAILGTEDFNARGSNRLYAPYFKDTEKVISYHVKWKSKLTEKKKLLGSQEREIKSIENEVAEIRAGIERLKVKNKRSMRGDSNDSSKIQLLSTLTNKKIKFLNGRIKELNNLINIYNGTLKEYKLMTNKLSIVIEDSEESVALSNRLAGKSP